MQKGKFRRPSSAPEARKERSCQSYSASNIKRRAERSFHRPAFIRPGTHASEVRLLICRLSNPYLNSLIRTQVPWSRFCSFPEKYFYSEFLTVTVKNPKNLTVSCHRAKKSVECYQGTPIQTLIKV